MVNTSLHLASSRNYINMVILLLSKGADVNILNKRRHSALCKAANRGNMDIVSILIRK